MSNTYTVWGMNGATRLAMNQHHMAGVLRMRGGLGDPADDAMDRVLRASGEGSTSSDPAVGADLMSVREVQEALKRRGHNPGAIDGQWGPSSRAAMKAFWQAEAARDEAAVYAQPATTQAEVLARVDRALEARKYWEMYGPRVNADTGATQISVLRVGPFRERLFAGGGVSQPRPRPPAPTPDVPSTPPPVIREEETDWTTWILAGAGITVAGVALWAVFRKRRKG